ncbi:unnamed protein product [Closterium sp. NIES-53]
MRARLRAILRGADPFPACATAPPLLYRAVSVPVHPERPRLVPLAPAFWSPPRAVPLHGCRLDHAIPAAWSLTPRPPPDLLPHALPPARVLPRLFPLTALHSHLLHPSPRPAALGSSQFLPHPAPMSPPELRSLASPLCKRRRCRCLPVPVAVLRILANGLSHRGAVRDLPASETPLRRGGFRLPRQSRGRSLAATMKPTLYHHSTIIAYASSAYAVTVELPELEVLEPPELEVLEPLELKVLELLLELVLLEVLRLLVLEVLVPEVLVPGLGTSGGTGGVGDAGAGDPTEPGAAGARGPGAGSAGAGGAGVGGTGTGGTGAGGTDAGGAGDGGTGARGAGAGGAGAVDPGGTVRPRPYFVPLLQQVLGVPSSTSLTPPLLCPPPDHSQLPLQPASPLPAPSPYTEESGGLVERREPASCPVSPVCTTCHVPCSRPPPVPVTHAMTLRPSFVPLHVPLPAPPESSLPEIPDPESDRAHATSPTVSRLLATAVTDPSFESDAAFALVAELLDIAAACRLDYATALAAESESSSPLSVGGECALGTDVLEDRQEAFECLAAAVPCFASMLLAPEGDPDAPNILTRRSNAEAITGPYSSQWQAAMDAEMTSWKSIGTYVNEVPPPGANIVDGMWIFRMKRPPGGQLLPDLLYVAAQRDYGLHSLDFSTAFLESILHKEIWLRCPPGFIGLFLASTQWSLRRPVYGLHQAPRECHNTLRTTLAAPGFAPSTADPSLFLRTDTSLLLFYVLVYVDDLVFATSDTEALTLVKLELQKRHTCTDLGELRSYLGLQITWDRARRTITLSQSHMRHTRTDLGDLRSYLGLQINQDKAWRTITVTQSHMVHQVLQRFGFQFSSPQPTPLSTSHSLSAPPSDESVELSGPMSGMGLVLGGRGPVVLTRHEDASYVDDSATQRLSQGYTFSLVSGSFSWRSTRLSSILSSICEAEIYAGAMAALELCWLTYLLTDLGEQPRSPPVLYRGQLRSAYVATRANTADIFTKALPPGDHQRFSTVLGLVPTLPYLLTV